MPLPIDPASLGSLANTMTSSGFMTLMEAAHKQQQEELARKTAEAAAASQQAGQAYQGAAAAPPPQLDPGSEFVPTLLGHIASVIGQDKSFTTRAAENVGDQRKALMDARLQNISALRANSDRKAAALEQAGHDEEAGKARMQTEKFDKLFLQLRDQQEHKNRLGEIKASGDNALALEAARGKNDAAAAETKAKADNAAYFGDNVEDAPGGGQYFNMGKVPNDKKLQNAARVYAHENGLKALSKDEDGKMKSVKEVILGIDQVTASMRGFLSPNLGLANAQTAGGNLLKEFLKSDPAVNSFGVSKELAIRTLSTLVSGAGSGVRITQSEVNLVNQNWPKLTDPLPVALAKMAWQKQFLMNKVTVAMGEKARPDIAVAAYTKLPAGAQFNDSGKVLVRRKSDKTMGYLLPNDPDLKLFDVVTEDKAVPNGK